ACLSNTGLYVVPPLTDFHTPPLADPMKIVRRWPSQTASMAEMRPLIAAEPMFRAPKPEIVSESTLMAGVWATVAPASMTMIKAAKEIDVRIITQFLFVSFVDRLSSIGPFEANMGD